ncbi:MAG: hypothetical protein UFP03_02855 [Paludibacteraceae bacterium]|nr:hypothetical protein [Paludibacteraceae bacterium]
MKKLLLFVCLLALFTACEKYVPTYGSNNDSGHSSVAGATKIRITNQSDYFTYKYNVNNKVQMVIEPGEYADLNVDPGTVLIAAMQQNGYPTIGKYKGMAATYTNSFTCPLGSFKTIGIPTFYKLRINNNDSSHRYKVTINGGNFIESFIIGTNKYVIVELDAAYYNIQGEQLDWILWPTDYKHDIYLNQNIEINYK